MYLGNGITRWTLSFLCTQVRRSLWRLGKHWSLPPSQHWAWTSCYQKRLLLFFSWLVNAIKRLRLQLFYWQWSASVTFVAAVFVAWIIHKFRRIQCRWFILPLRLWTLFILHFLLKNDCLVGIFDSVQCYPILATMIVAANTLGFAPDPIDQMMRGFTHIP